jgi:two-component system chemotaxis response regulator CheB
MKDRVFVIGASLSGINALSELVAQLPADFPAPILIAQHVASHSPGMLPEILTKAGRLTAVHPTSPTLMEKGRIYIAPPDRHMLVQDGYVRLSHGPHENLARPAIDPLFRSAAAALGPRVVGVILTGQLDDGTAGLLAVKDRGGITIVQDPSEATASSMPRSAIRNVKIDYQCTLAEMGKLFLELANDDPPGDGGQEIGRMMEIENRVAAGVFNVEDWWELEQLSAPSGLNCPNCRSALYELTDKRVLRFRCRSGHAFSALSLLSGQADAREMLLSSAFGAMIEEITLAKRIIDTRRYGDPAFLNVLKNRVDALEKETVNVCDWLHVMTGLVEPEPS